MYRFRNIETTGTTQQQEKRGSKYQVRYGRALQITIEKKRLLMNQTS
ncbi:hypothetical protein GF407_11855 [candidate division KSB1 bacterium]|nr:hypothetical protein [candidate division KSB1 bacterium]